jgi:hypothetical protein
MNHDEALEWLDRELLGLLDTDSPENHQRRRELRGIRDLLYAGRANLQVVDYLAPLCPCDLNPATTDGPQQECPIHGDGAAFVAMCRWRDAVVATVTTYRGAVADDGQATGANGAELWSRLCELLDDGPWSEAGPDYDRSGATP